jgi:hypothetical protein
MDDEAVTLAFSAMLPGPALRVNVAMTRSRMEVIIVLEFIISGSVD